MRRTTQIANQEGISKDRSQSAPTAAVKGRTELVRSPSLSKELTILHQFLALFLALSLLGIQDVHSAPKSKTHKSVETDLWQQLRKGFRLSGKQHRNSRSAAQWYKNNPEYLLRVTKRAQPFLYLIAQEVKKRNMPAEIALLPIVESAFHPYAYSSGKASGIWQFIPTTGQRFKLKKNWWYDGHKDVVESSRAALDYLQKLHRKFNGDWLLAIAAYNCGEGRVARARKANRRAGRSTRFWSLKLPKETRGYVPQLLGLAKVVSNPAAYGIKLVPIANRPVIANVNTGSQIDLALVSKLAQVDLKTIYDLNPAFNHWGTSPNGPYKILLPLDKKHNFVKRLAKVPKNQRMRMRRYRIKSGDTLSGIAKRYHIPTQAIKDVNNISGYLVAVGRKILIPEPRKKPVIYTASRKKSRRLMSKPVINDIDMPLYVVQPGDSLWKIGNEFNVSPKQLSKWNTIALNSRLHPGQKLKISTPTKPTKNHSPKGSRKKIFYKVRRGDSLWRISRKFKVAIKELRAWNDLPETHYLRPGRKLIIFIG